MKGSEILLKTLKDRGIRTVFGIAGREAEAILFNEAGGVDFVLTRDERSAAFMADMRGRLTGRAGACYSTFGPGATNLATGVASAYLDRSPMIAVSAQVERSAIHPSTHQCVDQVALMRPITKRAVEVSRVEDLEDEIAEAVAVAEEGVPGPCFLSVPLDVLAERAAPPAVRAERGRTAPRARRSGGAALEKLSDLVSGSRRPVVVVGNGAHGDGGVRGIERLLSRLSIPAVTTYGGKGVVSSGHACHLGTVSKYLEVLAPGALDGFFRDADLVVLAGFDVAEGVAPEVWERGARKKVCAINSILGSGTASVPVDLEVSLPYVELADRIADGNGRRFYGERELAELKRRARAIVEGAGKRMGGGSGRLHVFGVVEVLNAALAEDDIVVSDVGMHKQFVSLFYEARRPQTFFCSNGLGSMGFGLPAAIGAKSVRPESRVAAVCGDGGFHLSSPELETSVRCGLPVVCVVLCDGSVGLIKHYQRKGFGGHNPRITDFGPVDYVGLAKANGCRGCRVRTEDELRDALLDALGGGVSTVIEVPLDGEAYPL